MPDKIKSFKFDSLNIQIHESNQLCGKAASLFVADKLKSAIKKNGRANLILATGTSQFTFIEAIKKDQSIDWSNITVFHLDEYLGLSETHPASFRKFLRERILNQVKPNKVHLINGNAEDIDQELSRYQSLLEKHPIDVACIGIGENGHIAFNDPPVADFNDPKLIKIVELDNTCRKQQLGEGWFDSFDLVPQKALSLTIPAIMNAKTISCVVPDTRKAEAVYKALYKPISTECPASILRKHPDAILFLDKNASAGINPLRFESGD